MTEADIARFHEKVDRSDDDVCWPWRGSLSHKGYGTFWAGGKCLRSHRVSWSLANGADPEGRVVRHSCDYPPCQNPSHLLIGTHADNSRDMVERGRSARGDKSSARLYPEKRPRGNDHFSRSRPWLLSRGERHRERMREVAPRGDGHSSTKLSSSLLPFMFLARAVGLSQRAVTDLVGISRRQVVAILSGARRASETVELRAELARLQKGT